MADNDYWERKRQIQSFFLPSTESPRLEGDHLECQGSLCERHVCVCKRTKWWQTTLPLTNSCKFLSSAVLAAKARWSLPRTWAPESCPDISAGTSPPADRLRFGVLMCSICWYVFARSQLSSVKLWLPPSSSLLTHHGPRQIPAAPARVRHRLVRWLSPESLCGAGAGSSLLLLTSSLFLHTTTLDWRTELRQQPRVQQRFWPRTPSKLFNITPPKPLLNKRLLEYECSQTYVISTLHLPTHY